MKSKITYFMEKDTRLVLDNLTKEIINENLLLINYFIIRKRRKVKNKKIPVVRYLRDKNRVIIYDKLKKYNYIVYEAFIEWANEKGIKWWSIGSVIIDEKE